MVTPDAIAAATKAYLNRWRTENKNKTFDLTQAIILFTPAITAALTAAEPFILAYRQSQCDAPTTHPPTGETQTSP